MTIKPGDKLPDATLMHMTDAGPAPISTDELFGGKTVAMFAVPGAFTPTCSNQHLPGYIENAEQLRAAGVDTIVCISVNDAFVMGAWGQQNETTGKVMMVADGNAELTQKIGLSMDGSGHGMGTRSLRYSMIVRDGVVEQLNVEENPGKAVTSGAENLLSQLG
ncbi:MAG: peroxiredoxin [PS1 clade bacterium]|jgi:peroxiredoxin|uniref:Glutathione-dependent peroxiredoxin n=1 Tax=PS1 clade bacterium TaxID=2175152 RepID=A0A937HDR9_9PROT|nr:peroxiredoxin [PS1 clade bacterium]